MCDLLLTLATAIWALIMPLTFESALVSTKPGKAIWDAFTSGATKSVDYLARASAVGLLAKLESIFFVLSWVFLVLVFFDGMFKVGVSGNLTIAYFGAFSIVTLVSLKKVNGGFISAAKAVHSEAATASFWLGLLGLIISVLVCLISLPYTSRLSSFEILLVFVFVTIASIATTVSIGYFAGLVSGTLLSIAPSVLVFVLLKFMVYAAKFVQLDSSGTLKFVALVYFWIFTVYTFAAFNDSVKRLLPFIQTMTC